MFLTIGNCGWRSYFGGFSNLDPLQPVQSCYGALLECNSNCLGFKDFVFKTGENVVCMCVVFPTIGMLLCCE